MPLNKAGLALAMIISLALLIPGLTQPMITLNADLNRQALISEGKKIVKEQDIHPALLGMASQFLDGLKVDGYSRVYAKTRSLLGTAQDLWNSGYLLVAVLIVFFSAVIPSIKIMILLLALVVSRNQLLIRINGYLSKWSMADVFAIGVIIACLAANAGSSAGSPESALINFQAELHTGFYWFVAYCLVSAGLGQWLARPPHHPNKQPK